MRKELFSPLRIYSSTAKKFKNRYFYNTDHVDYRLAAPKTKWLPWIFLRTPSTHSISAIKVLNTSNNSEAHSITDSSAISGLVKVFQLRNSSGTVTDDLIFYCGGAVSGMNLSQGEYYLKIEDAGGNIVYSEDFCVVADTCDYVRISWLHSKDIDYFPYSEGYFHHLYVDSDLVEEEPLYTLEEVPDGQAQPIETLHAFTKRYSLKTDLLPPYLFDAVGMIPLHDTVTLDKPDLAVHIDNESLKNITFDGEWKTKMAYDGVLKFRLDTISRSASNENLNINELITVQTGYTLSTGFSSKFDACNDVGTPATSTYYSQDSTLAVGSVIYTQSGNAESTAPAGWYRDATNNKSYNLNSSGAITEIFTCLIEYSHDLVGPEVDNGTACASTEDATTVYSADQTLALSSVLYSISQDNTSYVANGSYMERGTDNLFVVSGGSGVINQTGSTCSETTHPLTSGFASFSAACAGPISPTNFYSRDSTLSTSSIVYTTSKTNNSFASAGWYKDDVNTQAIQIGSNGVVLSIIDCSSDVATYDFINNLTFSKENTVTCNIEGSNYGEVDTINIDLGTDGTSVSASYVISAADQTALGSEEIQLDLKVYDGTDNTGTLIDSSTVTGTSGTVSTTTLNIADTSITNRDAFVELTISNQAPV